MGRIIHFEGTCDVCHETISWDYDPSLGIIDTKIEPDGRVSTWIRHYATAPSDANPDCAYYSSVVTKIGESEVDTPEVEMSKILIECGFECGGQAPQR